MIMPGSPGNFDSAASITVVVSAGCHFCLDAQDALAEIARDFAIQVTTIDLRSTQGLRFAQQHRATISPLVLLDGQFVSSGRLPRGKLRLLLAEREGGMARVSP